MTRLQMLVAFVGVIVLLHCQLRAQTPLIVPLSLEHTGNYGMCIGDGYGNSIVSWREIRGGVETNYAQKISSGGSLQWLPGGVPLFTTGLCDSWQSITSDDSGGAFIARWGSVATTLIVSLQRVRSDGVALWGNDGLVLYDNSPRPTLFFPGLTYDGRGGCFVAWHFQNDQDLDIVVASINATGTVSWTSPIATPALEATPILTGDGGGGVIVCYNSRDTVWHTRIQRFSKDGAPLWGSQGAFLGPLDGSQATILKERAIVSDGNGGAIVAWISPFATQRTLYVQRVDSSGNKAWGSAGIALAPGTASPSVISDGHGGCIVTWAANHTVRAQRLNSDGTLLWGAQGVLVDSSASTSHTTTASHLASQITLLTWNRGYDSLFVATVDSNGNNLVAARFVYTVDQGNQYADHAPVTQQKSILVWNSNGDVLATLVDSAGTAMTSVVDPGDIPHNICLAQNFPNPFNPGTTIRFTIPSSEVVTIDVFSLLGQRVGTVCSATYPAGEHSIRWAAEGLSSGVYLYRLQVGNSRATRRMMLIR
jgi:hypothetical protein